MTKDEAIALAKTGWWRTKSPREIAEFQLREPRLCMDFSEYHEAVEKALGRPVFTHEFVRPDWLLDELAGKREALDPLDSLRAIAGPEKEIIVLDCGARLSQGEPQ